MQATTCCAESRSIRKSIRGIDLACRYGREEIRHRDARNRSGHVAGMVAERLRARSPASPSRSTKGQNAIEVTISMGCRRCEAQGRGGRRLLKRADTALYRAKHDGRNRWWRRRAVSVIAMCMRPNNWWSYPAKAGYPVRCGSRFNRNVSGILGHRFRGDDGSGCGTPASTSLLTRISVCALYPSTLIPAFASSTRAASFAAVIDGSLRTRSCAIEPSTSSVSWVARPSGSATTICTTDRETRCGDFP